MGNMRFKVGDRVRIKSLDWYNKNKNHCGEIPLFKPSSLFVPDMSRYCNNIMTIKDICYGTCYRMKEDFWNYNWTDEMIECKVEEETNPKFKIGDRVITTKGYIGKFEGWVSDYQVRVFFEESGDNVVIHPKNLKLVEEENIHNKWNGLKVELELSKSIVGVSNIESLHGERFMSEFVKAIIPPEGYQFVDENGNVINATKIVLEKKKKEYPKTYEECCKVLGVNPDNFLSIRNLYRDDGDEESTDYERDLLGKFDSLWELRICRDAYWKIAGEEMGLGKPWELSIGIPIYYIYYNRTLGTIKNDYADDIQGNVILAFPTEEMRDAFKENFDPDIEICKELL